MSIVISCFIGHNDGMNRHLMFSSGLIAVLLAALFLTAAFPVFSQTDSDAGGRGEYLTIKVVVAGPGDELYFWWGHIALVIEDALTGQDLFYDWGVFSFEADNFFLNFAFGRLFYRCGVSPAELNFRVYRETNRDITVYTLDLPAGVKDEIRRFAEWNVLPENRNYFYHHFKDNCATRVRDILDTATGGRFRAAFGEAPGRFTLRQHVRRHTWFSLFFDWLLNFLMGQDIDTPLTVWQEMFLPQEIGDRILDFTYTDDGGRERKLVSSVEVLNRAVNRPQVLAVPRIQWPRELAVGLAVSVLLVSFMYIRRKRPAAGRVLLGVSHAILGLFFGAAGSVLFFMTFFTNHDYTYHNINVIFVNPLLLAAVPLGILMAKKPQRAGEPSGRFSPEALLHILWTYVFLGGVLSMALKLLPWFYQQNQVDLAFILPIALTMSLAPSWAGRLYSRSGLPQ
jgi:hypothetical protein